MVALPAEPAGEDLAAIRQTAIEQTRALQEMIESFNSKLRDELLDREVFYTLLKVCVLMERYRRTYNRVRPHSSLGYRPPAPEALLPADPVPVLVGLT